MHPAYLGNTRKGARHLVHAFVAACLTFALSAPVPAANQSLEVLAPTREENNCTMPA